MAKGSERPEESQAEIALRLLREAAQDTMPVFPIPLVARPGAPKGSSSRLRHRHRLKVGVWRIYRGIITTLNCLNQGTCISRGTRASSRLAPLSDGVKLAHQRTTAMAFRESVRLERRRRDSDLTGALSVAALTKTSADELYSVRATGETPHTPLRPYDVDEPSTENIVPMLEALPWEEAEYYQKESNVLAADVCPVLFDEIQTRFGFVGGSYNDYVS